MNRFLTKKKSKAAISPAEETRLPPLPLPLDLPSSQEEKKRWRRKKPTPEPEPKFDLGSALPASDNFRTSLIMPNLSARFSMLRDQDDPHSLIGKANDDSVLVPKRRSRLGEFGHSGGLSDIDEASITEPIRRPFAAYGRQASYSSEPGYATDDDSIHSGSIMARARPGEGNVMFGGRQKIYKIPIGDAGAVKAPGSGEGRGMRGRALYEDDVSLSSFQKYKEKERELERQRNNPDSHQPFDFEAPSADSIRSPSLSLYDEKRGTTSSTNSGPYSTMSTSTAPTSVHSHAPSPGLPSGSSTPAAHLERKRSKRLYEQGLDQHLQEQQAAAMNRLYLTKRETPGDDGTSALHSTDPTKPTLQALTTSSQRISPIPTSERLTTFDSARERKGSGSSKSRVTPPHSRPLSPLDEPDKENTLTQAMKPSDRGKATAMGQFSRPKAYDDQQFSQRQMSLLQQRNKRSNTETSSKSNESPVKGARPSPLDIGRARAETNRSDRSWSASSGTRNDTSAFSAVSSATSQDRRLPSPGPGHARKSSEIAGAGTFFSGMDNESDDDDIKETTLTVSAPREDNNGVLPSPAMPSPGIPPPLHRVPPPMFKHPAMRASPSLPNMSPELSPQEKKDRRNAWNPNDLGPEIPKTPSAELSQEPKFELDRPSDEVRREEHTTGGTTGLSGLVREHLRQPSNQSSIYPPNTPALSETGEMPGFALRVPSEYSQQSNPWDLDELSKDSDPSTAEKSSEKQHQSSTSTITPTPLFSGSNTPQVNGLSSELDLDRELRGRHFRGTSSETQHERVAFQNELAERQRTIQENLRIKNESRSPSPHMPLSNKHVFDNSLKPFGLLSKKASSDSMGKNDSTLRLKGKRVNSPLIGGDEREFRSDGRRPSFNDPKSPVPVGRTLHSKMPRQSEEEPPSSRGQLSVAGSQETHHSPPESSRTSTSRDTTAPSEVSSGRRPTKDTNDATTDRTGTSSYEQASLAGSPPQSSLEISRSPPLDPAVPVPGRFRKDSEGSTCTTFPRFPVEPPTNGRNYKQDTILSPQRPFLSTSNSQPTPRKPLPQSNTFSTQSSPIVPTPEPNITQSYSSPNLLIPTNTSLSQTPLAKQAPQILKSAEQHYQTTLPTAAFNFPQRTPAQKPQRHRKGTINKAEISEPTLISSTSTADTVDLPQGASLRNDGTYDTVLGQSYGASSRSFDSQSPASPTSGSSTSPPLSSSNSNSNRRTFKKAFGSVREPRSPGSKTPSTTSNGSLNKPSPTPLYSYFPAAHSRKPSAPGGPDARFIRQLDGTVDVAGDSIDLTPRNVGSGHEDRSYRDNSIGSGERGDDNNNSVDGEDDGDDGYKPIAPPAGRLRPRKISSDDGMTGAGRSMSPRSPDSTSGRRAGQVQGGMF